MREKECIIVLRGKQRWSGSKLVYEKEVAIMLSSRFTPVKKEKIVSVTYTGSISIGETYGTVAKVIEFMTVKELFANADLTDEAQTMAMDYCNNKEDFCSVDDPRFGEDCIIVKFSEAGTPMSIGCMPIEEFYKTYIIGKIT